MCRAQAKYSLSLVCSPCAGRYSSPARGISIGPNSPARTSRNGWSVTALFSSAASLPAEIAGAGMLTSDIH